MEADLGLFYRMYQPLILGKSGVRKKSSTGFVIVAFYRSNDQNYGVKIIAISGSLASAI
ncbi:MAG: hypothetical protein ACYDDV_03340 [Methanoregula sp.]